MTIQVILPNGKTYEEKTEEVIRPLDLLEKYQDECEYQIVACRLNYRNAHLLETIEGDAELVFQDMRSPYGNMVYQASLTLMYIAAIHDILGDDVKVSIANSLSKGIFTRIHISSVTDELCEQIENRMHEMVEANLPIQEVRMDREKIIHYLEETGNEIERRMWVTATDLSHAFVDEVLNTKIVCYHHLVPFTSYIPYFNIKRYRNGVLLRFPETKKPDVVPPYEEQKLLYEAFSEVSHWENLMGINYIADLNEKVLADDMKDMVMLSEALHEKKIAEIAETIAQANKRIILIAGPSSSGKTTFAKRLCIQLRVIGLKPLYLGTDDYFMDREDMVPDENGELDFESLSAVDVNLFTAQMNALLAGQKVDIPEFDFLEGKKVFGKRITSIDNSQPIVIEGIHGLNPALTEGIDDEAKFKIYISPFTQINIDMNHRIPTTDARMLRRLVRDNLRRGRDAARTIKDWPSVRKGEEVYIFPYNAEADVFFNSQCLYELAVLKKYAKPLLEEIPKDADEYAEAQRMSKFLDYFVSIDDDSIIANNSIIREFIGGSIIV